MSHTAVTILSTLRLLLARTTSGQQRSRAESRRLLRTTTPGTGLLLARDTGYRTRAGRVIS